MKHDQEYIYKDKAAEEIVTLEDIKNFKEANPLFVFPLPPKETFLEKLNFKFNYILLFLKFIFPILWASLRRVMNDTRSKVIEYFVIKKALDPKRNKAILNHQTKTIL